MGNYSNYSNYPNYPRNPRFCFQSEQASEPVLVRNSDETEKRPGGTGEPPKTLCLQKENSLTAQMWELFETLKPTESHKKREEFAKKIEEILNEEWPGRNIKIHMFGSSMNELGTDKSDVDLCVTTEWNGLKNIYDLSNCLEKHGMKIEQIVSKAKVPIVRLSDPNLNLACDINVNNTLALHNTRLIRCYVGIDPRVRPLAMIIKYWARKRVLNDAAKGGTISTYTWTCIILNFLQMRNPPILPVLHKLPHDNVPPIIVNDEDASFYEDVEKLIGYGESNKESLGGLLFAFFRLMAYEFDYDNNVISLRQGKYLTKAEKGWNICKGWKMLCVEEPFNTARNLGNSADDVSVNGLKDEFRRAFNILYESANLESLCEQYYFTNYYNPYYNYNYNKNYNNRVNKGGFNKRNLRTNNSTGYIRTGNRPYTKSHNCQQNDQSNFLNDITDNIHDTNGKSNFSQDNEEDRSSMPRFIHVDNDHYATINDSGSAPVVEPTYADHVKREFNVYSTRKQDNYQGKRERNGFVAQTTRHVDVNGSQIKHQNVSSDSKEDVQSLYNNSQRNVKNNNSRPIKKKNDERSSYYQQTRSFDQFNNYGHTSFQPQDSDTSTYKSNQDTTSNQNQPFYKNNNQRADNNWNRTRFPSSDQRSSYSQNVNASFGSDTNRYNNNNNNNLRRQNTSSTDSDQKPFVTNNSNSGFSYDSDKRTHYKKSYPSKQDYNSRQVEDSNSCLVISPPLNSNFDRSNPAQMSSPKPGHKSNNNHKNNNKNTQFNSKLVPYTSNNYSMLPPPHNFVMNDSIYPASHGNGLLQRNSLSVFTSSQSSQQQIYHGQSNDGPANYPRRNSHQSSSDGSNSQTSGNTSNTSLCSDNNDYIKHNHQKNNNNQDSFHQQPRQNKQNSFSGKKPRRNNGNYTGGNYSSAGYEHSRSSNTSNTTNNSTPAFVLNGNDAAFNYHDEITVNISVQVNQAHYPMQNYIKYSNPNPNSWKFSNNNTTGSKIMNGNNNTNNYQKSVNSSNNSSHRNVNSNNSGNSYSRPNSNNFNNYNNNNNCYNGNNQNVYKSTDGNNNNSNVQTKNVNNNHSNSIKNGGNNNGNTNGQRNNNGNYKPGRNGNKSIRRNSSAIKNSDGVNHQQQYSQETQLFSQDQNYYNVLSHQSNNHQQEGGTKQKNGQKKSKSGQKKNSSQRISITISGDSME